MEKWRLSKLQQMFSEFVFKLDFSNNFESVLSFSDNLGGFPASCKTLFPILPCDGNVTTKYFVIDNRNERFSHHVYTVYVDILLYGYVMVHFITAGHITYSKFQLCYHHYYY